MTTNPTPDFHIITAGPEHLPIIREWAAAEGWNPGPNDGRVFHAQDPEGFFIGYLGDTPVSSVSVVNYGDDFAFLGFYLVAPEHRGKGLGWATWQHGVKHAGTRVIGLDGVLAQQESYRKSGFELVYRTWRYGGKIPQEPVSGPRDPRIVPVQEADQDAVAAFEAACFPADRRRFLAAWLATEGNHGLALIENGTLRGFGVVRPALEGARIGPLLADAPEVAAALFDALAADMAAEGVQTIAMDVPETNTAGRDIALARGLEPAFENARMYTGPVRPVAVDRIFGVFTLEVG